MYDEVCWCGQSPVCTRCSTRTRTTTTMIHIRPERSRTRAPQFQIPLQIPPNRLSGHRSCSPALSLYKTRTLARCILVAFARASMIVAGYIQNYPCSLPALDPSFLNVLLSDSSQPASRHICHAISETCAWAQGTTAAPVAAVRRAAKVVEPRVSPLQGLRAPKVGDPRHRPHSLPLLRPRSW